MSEMGGREEEEISLGVALTEAPGWRLWTSQLDSPTLETDTAEGRGEAGCFSSFVLHFFFQDNTAYLSLKKTRIVVLQYNPGLREPLTQPGKQSLSVQG